MADFTKRRGREVSRFLLGLLGLAVLLLITFETVRASYSMYGKFAESAAADQQTQAQLASLQAQDAQMSAEVASLSTSRGVEAQLREEYGVAKPGEGEIEIVAAQPATTSEDAGQGGNFFTNLWQALFGWI